MMENTMEFIWLEDAQEVARILLSNEYDVKISHAVRDDGGLKKQVYILRYIKADTEAVAYTTRYASNATSRRPTYGN